MDATGQTIDFAELLELDKVMTPAEIEDLTKVLEIEVWHRLLWDELPKFVSEEKLKSLKTSFSESHEPDEIITFLETNHVDLDLTAKVKEIALTVKEEFITAYRQQQPTD